MQTTTDITAPEAPRGRLLKILGVGFGLAVIIGNTIGAGILRTPGDVAAQLPDARLFMLVWIVGGLYALLGALSIAELGTMLPRSGGQYIFANYALGRYAGFIVGWSDWLSTCGTSAFVSLVITEYSVALFSLPVNPILTKIIALTIVLAFALLQWKGVSWGSTVQNLTSLLKTLAFIALITACFIIGSKSGFHNAPAETVTTMTLPMGLSLMAAIVLALQAVIYTYDGWTGVIYFSEEVRNPARDIPRAIFGGVLLVIAIYLLFNIALLYVLPLSKIAGASMAAGVAAQAIFGDYGDKVIRVLMLISLLSSMNAYQLMASRIPFAMGRDGLFSTRALEVNAGGTPTVALFASTIVALLFILTGTVDRVLAILSFFFVASYTISFISVFVLRRREPQLKRPYRAWGHPWTTAAALLISVAFLIGAIAGDTKNSFYSLLLLALSYPLFRWFNRTVLK